MVARPARRGERGLLAASAVAAGAVLRATSVAFVRQGPSCGSSSEAPRRRLRTCHVPGRRRYLLHPAARATATDSSLTSGDFCFVPDTETTSYVRVPDDPAESFQDVFKGTAIFVLPVAGPLTAFFLWQRVLQLVHSVLGDEKSLLELTQMTLNPTTNGIVVASLATALGTLTSITVWTLRQRQLDVRNCLNKEACDMSLLRGYLSTHLSGPCGSSPEGESRSFLTLDAQIFALLRQYVARVIAETSKRADLRSLECQNLGNSELAGVMRAMCTSGVPPDVYQAASAYITRLNDSRSMRLATLSTAFPLIHWVILALLASSIAICFLIEVDQSEGRFFLERPEDSNRLRLVFTILVGTFSGLSALCADLNDPYRGSFSITGATEQLWSLLAGLDSELERALVALNPSVSRGEVERAIKAADKDGDGNVDFDEFAEWLESRCM